MPSIYPIGPRLHDGKRLYIEVRWVQDLYGYLANSIDVEHQQLMQSSPSDHRTPDRLRRPDCEHERPPGVSDSTVAAAGQVTEALEWVERARGHLYEFHHMMGHADQLLGNAAAALKEAGHTETADFLREAIIGLDVLDGRWTFQIVEEFDDGYYTACRNAERRVRQDLMEGRRHVFEAELKVAEQRGRALPRPGRMA